MARFVEDRPLWLFMLLNSLLLQMADQIIRLTRRITGWK